MESVFRELWRAEYGNLWVLLIVCIVLLVLLIITFLYMKKENYSEEKVSQEAQENCMVAEKTQEPRQQSLLIRCPACGVEVSRYAPACPRCGQPIYGMTMQKTEDAESSHQQTVVVQSSAPQATNGVGTAGFVLSLISLMFSWLPGVGWVVWFLGFILSLVGVFRSPRGLAVAGFIISIIDLIVLISVVGAASSLLNVLL